MVWAHNNQAELSERNGALCSKFFPPTWTANPVVRPCVRPSVPPFVRPSAARSRSILNRFQIFFFYSVALRKIGRRFAGFFEKMKIVDFRGQKPLKNCQKHTFSYITPPIRNRFQKSFFYGQHSWKGYFWKSFFFKFKKKFNFFEKLKLLKILKKKFKIFRIFFWKQTFFSRSIGIGVGSGDMNTLARLA